MERGDSGQDGEDGEENESLIEASMDVHGIDWIAVFAYFDETGMNRQAPFNAVAGYLFNKHGARQFREKYWREIHELIPVNKKRSRIYHTGQCVLGNEEYGPPFKDADRKKIVELMTDAICESCSLGVTIALPEADRRNAVAKSPMIEVMAGNIYSQCLLRCMEYMVGWMDEHNPTGRIEYVFEAGSAHQRATENILTRIRASESQRKRYKLHDYSFREKGENVPQLYAPDLLGWEFQREQVNIDNPQRGEWRPTLNRLRGAVPHITRFMNETNIHIRAIVNLSNGITADDLREERRRNKERQELEKKRQEYRDRKKGSNERKE